MTKFQMIERVKMVYPDASETDIAQYLNDAYKEFVEETKLLRRSLGITLTADENVYPLPTNQISAIESVELYDTSDDLPNNVVVPVYSGGLYTYSNDDLIVTAP